jgi:cell wall-active antibiotic response 4TMS protein YvqF/B-box zinc finger protein
VNCANHSSATAVAYCRTCGKPLCNACSRNVGGVVYCETCVAEKMHGAAATQGVPNPPRTDVVIPPQSRPVVAGLLGFIPGVGAMYNGQFTKGVIHALTFVVLVFLTTHFGVLGILIGFFVFYMVFDAYKTSEAIQLGLPLPDPFGLESMFGPGVTQTNWQGPRAASAQVNPATGEGAWSASQPPVYAQPVADNPSCNNNVPLGAVILIGLGCLFLLDNMGWFSFSMYRFWPLILIVIGAWLFFKRWNRPVS